MSTDASTHDTPTPADAVVAAVDGSHRDAAVIEWAGAEAVALSAPLHLVHAVDLGTPLSAYGELLTSPEIVDRVEQESVRVVTEARATAEAARPGLAVTTALPTGSPSGALLAAAEGARVLVVGSARKNRAERIVLGTTSMSVVAHAPCPVVLVPENADATGDGRVVVGIDGSEHSTLAFQHALDAAARRGKKVTTVTSWNVEVVGGVVVTEPGTPEWETVDARYRDMAERTIAADRQAHPEIEVDVQVVHGRAADSLVEVAEGADLLLVGSRGRGGFRGMLLGSVSQRVLALATCPVAILHKQ
ncbi:universal stress protein [Janibacter limosus]|uniref:Universal stress protein n=1 Tax=Janibacter limosus TaxID=53458 RepID=A0A4P6MYS9_9MICO|nr:universal stress protein [Janibacter limosus]QBF46833.1 universal stress protein [Janibacter limosus]